MRPIDGDRLKQAISTDFWEHWTKCHDSDQVSLINMVLDDIDETPTLTQPNEWISVEDRLPEKNVDVLCWYEYFRYGDYNCLYRTFGIGYCINGYWGGEVSNGAQCRVLYWMPLPAPPESRPPEGEEEN